MPYAVIFLLLSILIVVTPVHSASKATCLERTLDTITINGTYLGYFEGEETNSVGIRVDKDDIYVVCAEEEANIFFGNSKGKQISLTYELQQFFLGEGSDGECMRIEVCKSGQIASSAQTTATQSLKSMFTTLKQNELVFHPCIGEGATMEQMCWENGKEGGTSTTTAVNHIFFREDGTGSEDGYKAGASPITWSEKDGNILITSDGTVSTTQLKNGMYLIDGDPMLLVTTKKIASVFKSENGPQIHGLQLGMQADEAIELMSKFYKTELKIDQSLSKYGNTVYYAPGIGSFRAYP